MFEESLIMVAQDELDAQINKYKGMKVSDIKKQLHFLEVDNKASFVKLARRMLNISNDQLVLCDGKIDAVLKTIRLTGNEKPAEPMSFNEEIYNRLREKSHRMKEAIDGHYLIPEFKDDEIDEMKQIIESERFY